MEGPEEIAEDQVGGHVVQIYYEDGKQSRPGTLLSLFGGNVMAIKCWPLPSAVGRNVKRQKQTLEPGHSLLQ